MGRSTRPTELETIVALVREGVPVRVIGAGLGLSGQAVSARLRAAGLSVGEIRGTRCAYCGATVPAARRRPGARHVCDREECRRQSERASRRPAEERRSRARCASCGKEMRYYATGEIAGPRFCGRGPCAAVYIRWRRTGEIRRQVPARKVA